ncbi:ATP-binding protein [Desulfovibrio mangrovi]|uniref:sensor histidine kinase n=1 Tax=Desulfovibrio mangrovi TaxID=2976983 RepID=UPI002245F356|nr:ATP-binding protein [Desulfovibrio mangrovi]UZP66938.1 ATP-binding protein [Desulfovibrio mangrovi]
MTPRPLTDKTQIGFAKFLSWTSLVLILVSSLILSVVISNSVRGSLLRKQQEFATLLAENLNHQIYRRFTLPTIIGYGRIALRNEQQYERLDQVVESTIHGLHVKTLRIYDYTKVIAYATDRQDLGDSSLAGMAVTRALSENKHSFEIESAMSPWVAMFQYELPPGSFILRTTYPLRVEQRLGRDVFDEADQPVMGVLEITQDITADYSSVISLQWLIVLTTMASSFLLFLLLVTFIRRSEKALAVRMAEKERLERDLHQSEKLASMGRVVSSIAHEIRNPLGIISSSAELLLKRPNTDALTQKILTAIYDEAKRLSKTVHDFLDYARPKPPSKERVDAAMVLDQALGFLENELSQRQVQVERLYEPGLVMSGDKDLLYRAFYNVIANGLQAISGEGGISIAGLRQDDEIIVTFKDSGSGFDLANIDKMLDPFFTTKDDGTGLGLAIVNSIVTSHGGTLMLSNAEEGGAIVRMGFPAA